MTIAMADKLVTSLRFTEEKKKEEKKRGLNSVFTDFIIFRLTESKIVSKITLNLGLVL